MLVARREAFRYNARLVTKQMEVQGRAIFGKGALLYQEILDESPEIKTGSYNSGVLRGGFGPLLSGSQTRHGFCHKLLGNSMKQIMMLFFGVPSYNKKYDSSFVLILADSGSGGFQRLTFLFRSLFKRLTRMC